MNSARIHGAGDMRLHDESIPVPDEDEMLVRVNAVGVCGSDVHWLRNGGIGSDRIMKPLIPDHERAGVIESGPRGERVAIDTTCSKQTGGCWIHVDISFSVVGSIPCLFHS
jgi:L-iditol 2-dehydrogenase